MQTVRFTFVNHESLHLGAVNTPRDKAFLAVIVFDATDGERKVVSSSIVSVSVSAMKRISSRDLANARWMTSPYSKR